MCVDTAAGVSYSSHLCKAFGLMASSAAAASSQSYLARHLATTHIQSMRWVLLISDGKWFAKSCDVLADHEERGLRIELDCDILLEPELNQILFCCIPASLPPPLIDRPSCPLCLWIVTHFPEYYERLPTNFCLAPGIGVDTDRAEMEVERRKGDEKGRTFAEWTEKKTDTLVLLWWICRWTSKDSISL